MTWTKSACLLLAAISPSCANAGLSSFFDFDILYLGDDNTALAPGSDEPDGATLFPGDWFQWTIASADDRFWFVETGGGFFPLMAFSADLPADYVADVTLSLRNDGTEVFSLSESALLTSEVHAGTNTVTLPTGLVFDEMVLDYQLVSVSPVEPLDPAELILSSRLPIFGAPENNRFAPGIVFVPEPVGPHPDVVRGGGWALPTALNAAGRPEPAERWSGKPLRSDRLRGHAGAGLRSI